jgi:hypothetical protein
LADSHSPSGKKITWSLRLIWFIQCDDSFDQNMSRLTPQRRSNKQILPFLTTYNQAVPNVKRTHMKHYWYIIENRPYLAEIFTNPPIVSYSKEKSLKDALVRAKLPRDK